MSHDDVLVEVREYISTNFLYSRPDVILGEDESLLATGVLDSMGVMELIAFLEEQYGIVVGDEDVTERNLGTLRAIVDYVATRRAAAEAAA